MYRLRGEDAIISFPGAEESVIRDRDVYMARTLRAAATGMTVPFLRAGRRCPDGCNTVVATSACRLLPQGRACWRCK